MPTSTSQLLCQLCRYFCNVEIESYTFCSAIVVKSFQISASDYESLKSENDILIIMAL
jgi:hypothetical protein